MKNIILSVLVVLTFNSSYSQESLEYFDNMNLKGNVQSIRETSYLAVSNSGKIEKGKKKLENPSYEKDFLIVLNENGIKSEKSEFNSDGSLHRKLNYKYDDNKNVIEETSSNPAETGFDNKFSYQYNNKGKVIEKDWLNADGGVKHKALYKYDAKENLTEIAWQRNDGSLAGKNIYHYDEKGNIIGKDEMKSDGTIKWKYTYKYDDNNKIIEENQFKKSNFFFKYVNQYDEKGNLTEINWCKSNGKSYRKFTSLYVYDKYNNWIKKTQFENDKPTYILEREIQYFNL